MSIKKKIKKTLDPKGNMKYWYGRFYEHARIDGHVILLESFHGKTIGDSPLVCAREIERLWPGKYKMYYATNKKEEHEKVVRDLGLNVELIDIFTKEYARILATAKYIISNASLPIYFIRKEDQVYLQTWHGTPWKTLGKQMREGIESMYNVQHNFIQASHLLFPNDFTREAIMRDYNLENLYTGKVVMCGYPRNEIFLQPDKVKPVREKYGLEGKTVYAYMPTWRGTSNHSIESDDYFAEVSDIFHRLDASMHDDQVMYVNFHPIIGGTFSFDGYTHIRPFPKDTDSYAFLNACDALVTDYSSVFFDYSLTRKPVVLFMYDYDKYMRDRGVYFDIRELPFRKIYDTDEFCSCIAEGTCLSDDYSGSEYDDKFLAYDAAGNTERLLKLVIDGEDTGLPQIDYAHNKERKVTVIAPSDIQTRADLMTLSRAASEKDAVALMYKKWFKNGVGQMLYDEFNDDFDYVITTDTPPRSHWCQLKKRLGSAAAKKHIHGNDVKRCFGDLDVDKKYVKNYGFAEIGYKANLKKVPLAETEVIPSDDAKITFRFSLEEGLKLKSLVIIDERDIVVWTREATPEEIKGNYAEFDFTEPVKEYLIYNRERCTPAILCEEADKDGKTKLVCFINSMKEAEYRAAKTNKEKAGAFMYATGWFDLPRDYKRIDIKKLITSPDPEVRDSVRSLDLENERRQIAIVPTHFSEDNRRMIRIVPVTLENIGRQISCPGVFKGYHFGSDGFTVKAFMPGWSAEDITGAQLMLGSKTEELIIPAEASAHDTAGGCIAELRFTFSDDKPLKPLRWNLGFNVRYGGMSHFLRVRFETRLIRYTLKMRNVQSRLKNGHILYPYLGLGGILRLTYREETEYDTAAVRAKEVTAMALHVLGRPVLRSKKRFIVYEKFCKTAQDNSYYFFRYCMEQLPPEERNRFWYVIDKRSPDYQYVKKYEPRVIQFMSIKHMLYAMNAKLLISTDSPPHLYAWQTKPSFVYSRVRKKPVYFLQHGVTAMKRVDNLFGMNGSNPMKYFVATSETEQRIIVNDFGYDAENAPIVGFTRWDALEDRRAPDDRFILIMPTWRGWLEDVSDEVFRQSDYYQRYYERLTSERFTRLLEDNGLRAVLYLHPKFANYIDAFKSQISGNVEMVAFGSRPLNDIMMRASMLITDYSSVCWDILYMDKPVVFYQFDTDTYLQAHGSYIDLRNDLPSPRVTEFGPLMDEVENYAANGFVIQDEYEEKIGKFFTYRDKHNCERTYRFLLENEK